MVEDITNWKKVNPNKIIPFPSNNKTDNDGAYIYREEVEKITIKEEQEVLEMVKMYHQIEQRKDESFYRNILYIGKWKFEYISAIVK